MGGPAYVDNKVIEEFDNFYERKFTSFSGITYYNTEQYFQSKKCDDREFIEKILSLDDPGDARSLGQECNLRADWENIKVKVMRRGNFYKFYRNKDLMKLLLSTNGSIIFKSSTDFWNKWNGKILEELRDFFKFHKGGDESSITRAYRLFPFSK